MNTSIFKEMFFVKKFISAIIIVSFILSLASVQPALALRNPQAGNAPATGHILGEEVKAGASAVGRLSLERGVPTDKNLGEVMQEEDAAVERFNSEGGSFSWVENKELFDAALKRAIEKQGEENVVIYYSLSAGKGARFERSEISTILEKNGIEEEVNTALVARVGEEEANKILKNDKSRWASQGWEDVGREVLTRYGLIDKVMPKVIYPMEGKGFDGKPFALRGKEAAEKLDMPSVIIVGYESDKVKDAIGKATYVYQPGFKATEGFIEPKKWYLGTGFALAQFLRVVPQDFKGSIFVSMGDIPFLDDEVLQESIDAYNTTRAKNPKVKAVALLGEIFTDPAQSSYGRMLFGDDMVLDRIIEVKDIRTLIANAAERPKDELIKAATSDAELLSRMMDLQASLVKGKIIIPDENSLSSQQQEWRKKLDELLKKHGLVRQKYSGALLDGRELLQNKFYNPAVYLYDHQALRGVISDLDNDNSAKEFYATKPPELLEEKGLSTVCATITNPWKIEGVNDLVELENRKELARKGMLQNLTNKLAPQENDRYAAVLCPVDYNIEKEKADLEAIGFGGRILKVSTMTELQERMNEYNITVIVNRLGKTMMENLKRIFSDWEYDGDALSNVKDTAKGINTWV